MRSQEQNLQLWLQRLAADPANAGNPLLAEFRNLAEHHAKLLRQFRKIAKISDRLQSETREMAQQQRQFVLMISHEFRTPLAIIDSASQMLEIEPKLPATATPRVRKIRNAVRRMLHLMDRCLADDRLDSLGAPPDASFDLVALLTELVAERGGSTPNHFFETRGFDTPLAVPGDRDLLAIVFSNLVENAIKYSPGGGHVRLALSRDDDRVVLRVEDEGIGVNAADGGRIFDKYFRASNAAGTTGAGLGLHLARRIVEMHGGGITVASEPDRGSTFTVSLPAEGAAERRAGKAAETEKAK